MHDCFITISFSMCYKMQMTDNAARPNQTSTKRNQSINTPDEELCHSLFFSIEPRESEYLFVSFITSNLPSLKMKPNFTKLFPVAWGYHDILSHFLITFKLKETYLRFLRWNDTKITIKRPESKQDWLRLNLDRLRTTNMKKIGKFFQGAPSVTSSFKRQLNWGSLKWKSH